MPISTARFLKISLWQKRPAVSLLQQRKSLIPPRGRYSRKFLAFSSNRSYWQKKERHPAAVLLSIPLTKRRFIDIWKIRKHFWKERWRYPMSRIITLEPADYMTVAMGRLIQDGERIFHGVASPMPAVAIQLAEKHHAKRAVYLSIAGTADAVPTEFYRHTTAGANLRE